jgi:hypothetical protein
MRNGDKRKPEETIAYTSNGRREGLWLLWLFLLHLLQLKATAVSALGTARAEELCL